MDASKSRRHQNLNKNHYYLFKNTTFCTFHQLVFFFGLNGIDKGILAIATVSSVGSLTKRPRSQSIRSRLVDADEIVPENHGEDGAETQ